MPTPPESQQNGILIAMIALAGSLAGALGALVQRWVAGVNRRTQLELNQADKPGAFTDDLQAELTSIRQHNQAQMAQMKSMNEECNSLRKDFNTATMATVERERKISHLENELEKLQNVVAMLREEKTTTKQQYDERIVELQNEAIDREASHKIELADRDATIAALQKRIDDFEKIGVTEPPPPKRGKE